MTRGGAPAFIGPYRPTAGWVVLVISHSAMR